MSTYFDPYIPGGIEFRVTRAAVKDPDGPPNASNQVVPWDVPFNYDLEWERLGILSNLPILTALAGPHNWNTSLQVVNVGSDPSVVVPISNSLSAGDPTLTTEIYKTSTIINAGALGLFRCDPAAGHSGIYDLTPLLRLNTGLSSGIRLIVGTGPTMRIHLR